MINVDDALRRILKAIKVIAKETVALTDSLGRVLAEDIYSASDIPGFDNSAMDGYALKSADTTGASIRNAKTLAVIEDVKAGDIPKNRLKNGEAVRIMTGAMLPKGADAVVMVELTKKVKIRGKESVEIYKRSRRGENVRRAGEDIKKGELVLRKGVLLNSAHIGVLASLGKSKVRVARKPRVAVLATGNEVIDVDERLTPGKIRSSNSYTLCSQVINAGGIPKNLGIAKDTPAQLKAKIKQSFGCDLLITSGGVSVGDYDLVKDILLKLGTNIEFWKVAMRPGKPMVFGLIRGIPVFGLPGNPVSSMVAFEIFVRPAIAKMLDQSADSHKEVEAMLQEDIGKKKGLRYFLRGNTVWRNNSYQTRTSGPQGSGMLKSMAQANSLIILPEEKEFIKKGSKVRVRLLD